MINIKIPSPHLTFKVFEHTHHYEALNESGLYTLKDREGRILYIGKSVNVYNRLKQHIGGNRRSRLFAQDIAEIEVVFVSDPFYLELYETYAINTLRPLYNVDKHFKPVETDETFEIDIKINDLKDERQALREEIADLREYFDELGKFTEEFNEEQLYKYGELLKCEERRREIKAEIKTLNDEKNNVKKT